jgi:hypothetical protein
MKAGRISDETGWLDVLVFITNNEVLLNTCKVLLIETQNTVSSSRAWAFKSGDQAFGLLGL